MQHFLVHRGLNRLSISPAGLLQQTVPPGHTEAAVLQCPVMSIVVPPLLVVHSVTAGYNMLAMHVKCGTKSNHHMPMTITMCVGGNVQRKQPDAWTQFLLFRSTPHKRLFIGPTALHEYSTPFTLASPACILVGDRTASPTRPGTTPPWAIWYAWRTEPAASRSWVAPPLGLPWWEAHASVLRNAGCYPSNQRRQGLITPSQAPTPLPRLNALKC